MSDSEHRRHRRPSFTTWIVIGLVAGVCCGLFFGEYAASIKWIGDAYVGLLQMTVLPYVTVSLVANIGQLSASAGIRLMRTSVLVLLLLWAIGLATLVIAAQAFPDWDSGSFFSSRFTEEPSPPDWLDLFIPSNPFRALSENAIPAVVVFSIGLGITLMSLPNKETLLEPLNVLLDALAKLNKLVVRLTPLGMFAIVAHAAGTIDLGQFSLIQGYLLAYCVPAVILAAVVLPAMVAAITPLKYWDVVRASRDPLITAFVIGNSFVVLPMIAEAVKRLQEEHELAGNLEDNQPEYLVPLAYPFPDIGKIVSIVFIPFAAWFYGNVIDLATYPALMGVGLLGSFGKLVVTIPLLLNIAELPSDIFNLFLASGVVASRFGDLMKSMHLMTFTIVTIFVMNGTARFRPAKLVVGCLGSLLLLLAATLLIRGYLSAEFRDRYSKERLVTQREMVFPPEYRRIADTQSVILTTSEPNPLPIAEGQTRVERIRQYGRMRIGFRPDKMPFSYFNDKHELIGFDIQMAHFLANDLKVGIEFVPIERGGLRRQLDEDHFDIAMSALEGTVKQAASLPAIDPYMDVTLAVVVPDHAKRRFRDTDQILAIPDLKLAVVKNSYFAERAPKDLPANVKVIELDSATEFFEGRHRGLSGLVISAESGSAWTLRYPQFTVANPLKGRVRVPLYYLTDADTEFEIFLHNWLRLKRASGVYEDLYDYWILGKDPKSEQPRWSILRDVLGWVK